MKRLTLWLTCLFISMGLAIGQNKTVSGTVVDEAGEPVIGASVVVKGNAAIGTVTDLDGKFTLSVPASAQTLIIKYLGMADQEAPIAPDVRVTLSASETSLDEVIVVAYGTAKRSQFTGSASVVKAEEIGKVQASNAANALVGKVTGMQIANSSGQPGTTSPTIRVRGIGSINAGNDPLIIVDGAPYSGDLNNINSQDIESITVLKDAASNALYGARGANGVIMITTKKGTSGVATITADAKWGANTRATQDYKTIQSPAQYYEVYHGALKNYFVNSLGYTADNAHLLANQYMTQSNNDYGLGYNVYSVPAGQYLIGSNGKLNPNATLGNIVSYGGEEYLIAPDNWTDAAYKQSTRQEYNFSATAGTDKSSFFASFNYLNNQGITAKSDYQRLTGRLKADYQVKPWMKVGGNMLYTNYRYNSFDSDTDGSTGSSGNIFAFTTRIAPIYPLYIRDGSGNIRKDANGLTLYDYGDKRNAGLERPFLTTTNGLSDNLLNTYGGEGNAFAASGFVDITFLKDFKFSTINTTAVDEDRFTSVTNPYYGQYASSNGIVYKQHVRRVDYDLQQLLTYAKDIDVHHVNLLVGHDYYRSQYFTLYAEKSNMFDPANHELNGAVKDGSPGSYTTDYNTEGFFSRGQYDYDNKYYASLSYRRDATSRFHPDNRWGNFWSVGAAWVLSGENWLDDWSWVDLLKLKASYGEQGNDNIGNYRYVDTYSVVNATGRPATIPDAKGNKDISWEKYGNFNTGIDFDLFKQRLSGTIEYFYRKTTDMLFSFPLPPSYGWTSYYDNIGDMRNTGVEVELKGDIVKTNDFKWNLSMNITLQSNKIIYLPEERKTLVTSEGVEGYAGGGYFYGEGQPLYTFYMKKYAGVNEKGEATYYKDIKDEDGNITGREPVTVSSDATDYLCGTALPDAFGGFSTSFTYKGFDLSADFVYQIGGLVYDTDYASNMNTPQKSSRGAAFHADVLNAWTPENTSSNIPRFQYGDQYTTSTSDRFLTSASFLSLQNINFGYTFSKRISKYLGAEKVKIYTVCDNVWLWSKRQGLDPRQNINGSSTSAYYAPIRSFSGGISVTF